MTQTVGLLVMAYGTPYEESEVEAYYTDIRHGKKPEPEEIEDLKARYRFIGGVSPLARITDEQAEALRDTLNKMYEEKDIVFKLYIGLKHIHPFIEDALEQMHEDGINKAVTIVLTPHYSNFSVGAYDKRADEEAEKYGISLTHVKSFYQQPKFIQYWVKQINHTLNLIPKEEKDNTVLIVSAHSLPENMIVQSHDPYPNELRETTRLLKELSNVTHVAQGWQSEGNTGTPWLGPDVQDLTRSLYQKNKYQHFIYAPVGFVCNHLEVLYDNDYECKLVCDEVGAVYHRPPMPNTDPLFMELWQMKLMLFYY
uniref:Coproporphyrin III ferrochelatase n=1 Tax=Staphylococcus staphylolyticus TaxID=1287 RepID=D3X7L7_STAST|nr:ferrochelatase [Staphylococcus simulans]ADD24889.1 putative ferrochelatase [Staphylococcus simulans bv. staphylolyticus]